MDRSLHFHRLASTFTDYYRLLLLHCGLPYWQYKYTDFGVPPYILHWYYIIVPFLLNSPSNDDTSLSNLISFNVEKVFQRNTIPSSKSNLKYYRLFFFFVNFYISVSFRNSKGQNQQNSTGQTQQSYSLASVRSATQNQKRPFQQTKRYALSL